MTEGEHTVQMLCSDLSPDSNRYKIGLGHGVPGTILQMPISCGPGKYAVAKDMVPLETSVLPRLFAYFGVRIDRTCGIRPMFHYDSTRVPRDLADTQMRVDFSNQNDY